MILVLAGAIGLAVWLVTVGIYDTLPITNQRSNTYLSSSGENHTVILVVLDAFRYDYSHRYSDL